VPLLFLNVKSLQKYEKNCCQRLLLNVCKSIFSIFAAMPKSRINLYLFLLLLLLPAFADAQINYRHFVNEGRFELSKENYLGAIKAFNTALYTKKDGFEAYFLRGIAKFSLGDSKGAENDFSATLKIHPLYVRAYHYRGIARDRLYEYSNAISDFDRALEIDPFNPEVFMARGDTKMHLSNFMGAIDDYSQSIDLDQKNATAWLNRGVAKHFLGRNEEALEDLNQAILLDYFSVEAWTKRGMVNYEIDSLSNALSDYNQAIKLDDKNPYVFFQRGLTYLKLNDTTLALNDYNTVVEMEPTNALTYYNIALIKSRQKDYKGAFEAYQKVVDINPNNVYAFYNRGTLYYVSKNYRKADKDFSRAIEIFPDFAGAYINRSAVRYKMGRRQDARNDEQVARDIIAAMNGDAENYELLYRRYGDSTYFDKIMEFEADFVSGNTKKGRVQFSRVAVEPKPNFFLVYAFQLPDSLEMKFAKFEYLDEGIAAFNARNDLGIRLVFSTHEWPVDKEKADEILLKTDSTIAVLGDTAAGLFIKGVINSTLQNYASAINSYDKCIEKDQSIAYAYLNRGATRYELDELIFTEKEYSNSITISRSTIKQNENKLPPDHKLSLADFEMATNLNRTSPFAFYNMANLKIRQQKFQRAIDDYSMAIRLEPKMAEAYFNRALTLLYLEEDELACKDLSKAGELGIVEAYNIIKRYCGK